MKLPTCRTISAQAPMAAAVFLEPKPVGSSGVVWNIEHRARGGMEQLA
ncbi:MAG: hypothetical protein ACYDDO_12115 [Acidiferrobacterales bacterium]